MTSKGSTSNMFINTWFIWKEIFINWESSFDWSIGKDFGLDFSFVIWDWVWISSVDFIWVVIFSWFWMALLNTIWGWLGSTAWLILSSSVMITWSKWISSTPFFVSKKTSCNKTFLFKETPSSGWESTVTSESTIESTTS